MVGMSASRPDCRAENRPKSWEKPAVPMFSKLRFTIRMIANGDEGGIVVRDAVHPNVSSCQDKVRMLRCMVMLTSAGY